MLVFGGWGCGACTQCAAGEEQRCERSASPGFQRDGGYAEYMLVPHARHLVPLGRPASLTTPRRWPTPA